MAQSGNGISPWWFIIGGLALAALAFKTAADATALNYEIQSFDLAHGTLTLGIINPTGSTFTLNALTADVNDNDSRVAIVNYLGQVVINPIATTPIKLNVKVDPTGVAQELLQAGKSLIFDGSNSSLLKMTDKHTFTVSGSANIDGIMVPFDTTLSSVTV